MPTATTTARLRRGDKGPAVKSLQERLNAHGARSADNKVLETDGLFGARTQEAVSLFQRTIDHDDSGVADELTLRALSMPAPQERPTSPATPSIKPLFVDVYREDTSGDEEHEWKALIAKGAPWHGAILKATQGTAYRLDWFRKFWPLLKSLAGERYGVDWFRGAYAFLNLTQSGVKQAEYFLRAVDAAGGWSSGDLWPFLDVELGNDGKNGKPKGANWAASKSQIVDCTLSAAEFIKARTGREVGLYGNGAMRDKGIRSKMGCSHLWLPRYSKSVPSDILTRAGWNQMAMWQYAGDGANYRAGYPKNPGPFFTDCQVSSLELPGGLPQLRQLLAA